VPGGGPQMTGRTPPRRVAATLLAASLVASLLTTVLQAAAPAAGAAAGGGGASSGVTRDGRIITSIILRSAATTRPTRGLPPAVRWVSLTDLEVAWLLQLIATDPAMAEHPLLGLLADGAAAGTVQIRVRGDQLDEGPGRPAPWRLLPDTDVARVVGRRMVTVLPRLTPTLSPPVGAPVVVGTPTFVSFDLQAWATVIDRTLTVEGTSARVRAWPVTFQVRSGDPADVGTGRSCAGPGTPFRVDDPTPPREQARRPGACTLTYRTVTGVRGRRSAWTGDVTVLWRAEWTTDGVSWRSLGLVPRLGALPRSVVESEPVLGR
jgi:hypothetical protein